MTVQPIVSGEHQCAVLARLRHEPMAGSAPAGSRFALIEQPGAWGRNAVQESGLDPQIASQVLARAGEASATVLLIRRPGRDTASGPRRWALVECDPDAPVIRWGTYGDPGELLRLDFAAAQLPGEIRGEVAGDVTYLVCAHSKRDVCCSLRGRPVAAALEQLRPGRTWEVSHIGGHRFAANVVVLPLGQVYGRVEVPHVPALVEASERGDVVADLLRGRCGYSPAAQAAIVALHNHLALAAADALRPVGQRPVSYEGGDAVAVTVATPEGHAEVVVASETVLTRASCRDDSDRPEPVQRVLSVRLSGT